MRFFIITTMILSYFIQDSFEYLTFGDRCLNFPVKKDFNSKKLANGTWFELYRLPNVFEGVNKSSLNSLYNKPK